MTKFVFRHELTGDEVEIPPPDFQGNSVVRFNGQTVERVTYSDVENSVTTQDGLKYFGDQWPQYIMSQLLSGAWKVVN